ncbi:MAG: DUF5611 family protein [Candidatus Poseidoniales archaeon]|nr:DUF5611 family protein [Candidatus Poseidoniales archaeon]
MERFAVKRGLEKSIGGNAGLAKMAAQHFDNVQANSEGEFQASFGLLSQISGCYTDQGKLQVDVVQLKGSDLEAFLSAEGGREQAMESRRRWSAFLDEATGYTAKQRGDKAKEDAKKFSKAKSAIKMIRKTIEMSSTVTQETIDKAETMIAELEGMIERGVPPSEGKVKKLSELV